MSQTLSGSSPLSFVHNLKIDPELNFHNFKSEVYNDLMNTENAILGPNGLLFIILSDLDWQNVEGNLLIAAIPAVAAVAAIPAVPAIAAALGVAAVAAIPAIAAIAAVAAIPAVYRGRYDYMTPVPTWAPGAPAGAVKSAEMLTANKAKVYGAVTALNLQILFPMKILQHSVSILTESVTELVGKSMSTWLRNTVI